MSKEEIAKRVKEHLFEVFQMDIPDNVADMISAIVFGLTAGYCFGLSDAGIELPATSEILNTNVS